MAIDALTVIYPPQSPALETSLQTIGMFGGVFSQIDDIVEVYAVNLDDPDLIQYGATLTPEASQGDYFWEIADGIIPLFSIGINTLRVTAIAADGDVGTYDASLFVDYIPPTLIYTMPANDTTDVSSVYTIALRFDETLDVDSSVTGVTIDPDPGGTWIGHPLRDDTLLYSTHLAPMDGGTTYTISFGPEVRDRIGNSTLSDGISFTTEYGNSHRFGLDYDNSPEDNHVDSESSGSFVLPDTLSYVPPSLVNPFRYNHRFAQEYFYDGLYEPDSYFAIPADYTKNWEIVGHTGFVPPLIINPFRYFHRFGKDYVIDTPDDNFSTVEVYSGYQTTGVITPSEVISPFRYAHRFGKDYPLFIYVFDLTAVPWFPLVIDYEFNGLVLQDGLLRVLSDNSLAAIWDVPNAMRGRPIFFKVQLSRTPSFFTSLSIDSYYNNDSFEYSEDEGVTWNPCPITGVRRKTGRIRFTSQQPIEGGLWYFRILAGYKKQVIE